MSEASVWIKELACERLGLEVPGIVPQEHNSARNDTIPGHARESGAASFYVAVLLVTL